MLSRVVACGAPEPSTELRAGQNYGERNRKESEKWKILFVGFIEIEYSEAWQK